MVEKRRNVVARWDSVEALVEGLLDHYNDELRVFMSDSAAQRRQPTQTAFGEMKLRLALTDANGNDIEFPVKLVVEATFDLDKTSSDRVEDD